MPTLYKCYTNICWLGPILVLTHLKLSLVPVTHNFKYSKNTQICHLRFSSLKLNMYTYYFNYLNLVVRFHADDQMIALMATSSRYRLIINQPQFSTIL